MMVDLYKGPSIPDTTLKEQLAKIIEWFRDKRWIGLGVTVEYGCLDDETTKPEEESKRKPPLEMVSRIETKQERE